MPSTPHPGVMISSTVADLEPHRPALMAELLKADLFPKAMENAVLGLRDDIITNSLGWVETTVAYIGIISLRSRFHRQRIEATVLKVEKGSDAEKPAGKRKESAKPATPDQITAYAPPSPSTTSAGLSFAFPLRTDFLAQLVLPRDMKTEEAHRLCAFIKALAVDSAPTA